MKTAEQWYSEGGLNNDAAEIQHRREIQADALRSAAKEVREATNFPEDRGALSKAAMILEGIAETVTAQPNAELSDFEPPK